MLQAHNVQQQLRDRETYREAGQSYELREYDTGQVIRRNLVALERPRRRGAEDAAERSVLAVETVIHNRRSGEYRREAPGGASASGGGEFGYPELQPLVNELERAMRTEHREQWGLRETAGGLLATLAGHGNIPPMAVFHPATIWSALKGLTIGHRRAGFDLRHGEKFFREQGRLIPADLIGPNYAGMVARVAPLSFCDQSSTRQNSIEIMIFNPARLAAAQAESGPQFPAADQTVFRLCLFHDVYPDAPKAAFYSEPYQWRAGKDGEKLMSVDAGFYIEVAPALAATLERLAPLPVELSDCGSALNAPEDSAVRGLHVAPDGRRLLHEELLANNRDVLDLLSEADGWQAVHSARELRGYLAEPNARYVVRHRLWETDAPEIRRVPEELAERVLRVLENFELYQAEAPFGRTAGDAYRQYQYRYYDTRLGADQLI